ncbi:unnamed protein product [Malus baccata var. baccata]
MSVGGILWKIRRLCFSGSVKLWLPIRVAKLMVLHIVQHAILFARTLNFVPDSRNHPISFRICCYLNVINHGNSVDRSNNCG